MPDSVRGGQRLTGMTSGQKTLPIAPSVFSFQQHGQSGTWLSELLPHTARLADDLCLIRSLHTEAINHDPAMTFLQTGHQLAGRPSLGAWLVLWPGDRERGPARLCGDDFASHGPDERPAVARADVGRGVPALALSGRAVQRGQRPGAVPFESAGHRPRPAAPDARRPGPAQPAAVRRLPGSGDPGPHRAVRAGLSHAGFGARTGRSLARAGFDLRAVRPRVARSRAPMRPIASWPGGWPNAACGSSSCIIAAGTSTTTCPAASRASATTPISRRRRWSRISSSAACWTTRWSSGAANSAARSIRKGR